MAMRDLIPRGRAQSSSPALWRDNDWSPVSSLRREMDRLFDDFFRAPALGGGTGSMARAWPRIDVSDEDKEVIVTAEVPGMTGKDVDLFVDDGILTIRGEKKSETDESGYSERWYGRFERQIPLPSAVDEEHCRADFHDGLLTVHLPKTREAEEKRRKIPINADTRH